MEDKLLAKNQMYRPRIWRAYNWPMTRVFSYPANVDSGGDAVPGFQSRKRSRESTGEGTETMQASSSVPVSSDKRRRLHSQIDNSPVLTEAERKELI